MYTQTSDNQLTTLVHVTDKTFFYRTKTVYYFDISEEETEEINSFGSKKEKY